MSVAPKIAAVCITASLAASGASATTFFGEFWDGTAPITNLAAADALIASRTADATFISTGIDYPQGGNRIRNTRGIGAFLGSDAASLQGVATSTDMTYSVFRFTGFVDLDAGIDSYNFRYDDGFRVTIGTEVIAFDGLSNFRRSTGTRDLGDGPPVTALLIQNINPAVVCPETRKCLEGLARDDLFTCVHEQFMTDTAAMADVVLPATTFLEHDDYYTASGHTFLQATKAVIDALPECRSNHEVHCGLAKRLGAEHPGFDMTAWELIEATFEASGHPPAEQVWQEHWLDCAEPFEKAHFLDGFPQADQRFHFKPDWSEVGRDHAAMPRLPGHWDAIDGADAAHPFRLVAAPARSFLNTSFTETPGSLRREGRPSVLIHPQTCENLGIADGDRVRLGNRLGSIVIHARVFDGLQPDVLVVESVWPNAAFEEGLGINTLVSADPGPPLGGAVFHDTAVWIRPA